MRDYYEILGISRSATKEEVKRAYRKLAHQYHPDKKGGDEKRFKEINEAYQILSNDEKRAQYDQFGRVFEGVGTGAGPSAGGWDFGSSRGFEDFDMSDIFENFFGSFSGTATRAKRGRDISIDIEIPFQDSIFGTERRVLIRKKALCDTCRGTGKAADSGEKTCEKCHGAGTIRDTRRSFLGTYTQIIECSACGGRGKIPEKKCHTCRGEGVLVKGEEIRIVIPPGIEDGEVVRIPRNGEALRGGEAGDLYVKVHVLAHPVFKRSRSDLLMKLELPLSEAVLGSARNIQTLDGAIKIKIPQGVNDGEVLKVRGKGALREDGTRGDLLIEVKIRMPKKMTPTLKALAEELQRENN